MRDMGTSPPSTEVEPGKPTTYVSLSSTINILDTKNQTELECAVTHHCMIQTHHILRQ